MIKTGAYWCPNEECLDPPIYGDPPYRKGYKHPRRVITGPSSKLQNTPRSDRSNQYEVEEEEDVEMPELPEWSVCKNIPWKKNIPPGADLCCNPALADLLGNTAVPKALRESLKNVKKENQVTKTMINRAPYDLKMPRRHCSRNSKPELEPKKAYYNMMWDPRICRGSTKVRYKVHQEEKCKKRLELTQWLEFRKRKEQRLEKRMAREGGYLDKRSDPTGRILYPKVEIEKIPLSYDCYSEFLVDNTDNRKFVNKAQTMRYDGIDKEERRCKGKDVMVGPAAETQTEVVCCWKDTEDWIVKTLLQKIPDQGLREVIESTEMALIRGERKWHELLLIFEKWNQLREDQWNEWLYQWNEIRMREILEENKKLEALAEMISVISFARSGVDSCFCETLRNLKIDRFIHEQDVPWEEMREVSKIFDFDHLVPNKLELKNRLAEKILSSIITQAAAQRFVNHMNSEFGKPHGRWIQRQGMDTPIDYDDKLQKYLGGRWIEKRPILPGTYASSVMTKIRTDFGFKTTFEQPQPIETMMDPYELYKLERQIAKADFNLETITPPPTPAASVARSVLGLDESEEESEVQDRCGGRGPPKLPPKDELAVIYERKSSFDVEKADEIDGKEEEVAGKEEEQDGKEEEENK